MTNSTQPTTAFQYQARPDGTDEWSPVTEEHVRERLLIEAGFPDSVERLLTGMQEGYTTLDSKFEYRAVPVVDLDTDDDATQEAGLAVTLDQFDITKHDCVVTLVSPKTGDHRTFKISTVHEAGHGKDKPLAGKRIVSLLTGPDNQADFQGFAFVTEAGGVKVWQRFRGQDGLSEWEKFADLLASPNYWAARGVTYQFSLRCRRCGRPLTVPESITSGLGPICVTKV